ncbi:MAG: SRPBCC family protein [Actinomycetota bacterium]|nr:SRPBCC family protein [Actinomycetota bacterium]
MDLDAAAVLRAPPERVFAEVADLSTYPEWLGIVHAAEPAPPHDGDQGPAWMVDLGARLGPLRRTKRVRMVRTEQHRPKLVRFEREEHDGRTHSAWILTAEVEVDGNGSRLTLRLHYGGALKVPAVELVLREEIRRAGDRLQRRLAASTR